jgi:hypothetical protein
MYTGKLYVLDKYRRDSQLLGRPSAISTTHSSGYPAHSFASQSDSSSVLPRKTLGTTRVLLSISGSMAGTPAHAVKDSKEWLSPAISAFE